MRRGVRKKSGRRRPGGPEPRRAKGRGPEVGGRRGARAERWRRDGASEEVRAARRPKRRRRTLAELVERLDHARGPLFREHRQAIRELAGRPDAVPPHELCTRAYNQMRISDLEAIAIARAFRREPHLIRRQRRIRELAGEQTRFLKKGSRRQNYTCPLLEGERCLVHQAAKPVACLAWNGRGEPSEAGSRALSARNRLNDRAIGSWDLRAIPVQLARYFDDPAAVDDGELARGLPERAPRASRGRRASGGRQRRFSGAGQRSRTGPAASKREASGTGSRTRAGGANAPERPAPGPRSPKRNSRPQGQDRSQSGPGRRSTRRGASPAAGAASSRRKTSSRPSRARSAGRPARRLARERR